MCDRSQCPLLPSTSNEDEVFIRTKLTPVGEVIAAFPSAASILSPKESKKSSPLKAIRKHCKECSGYNASASSADCASIKGCHVTDCHFWPFRFGKRPEKMIAQGKGELVTRKRKT